MTGTTQASDVRFLAQRADTAIDADLEAVHGIDSADIIAAGVLADSGTSAAGLKSTSPSAGVGYATGAGGAIAQASSRTTGVTVNAVTGAITLVSAAGSATPATFVVTNSAVAATDVVVLSQKSGTDKLELFVTNVTAGAFSVTFFTTGGTTTETPVINFAVIKGVAA
jgi:hypothetical protein